MSEFFKMLEDDINEIRITNFPEPAMEYIRKNLPKTDRDKQIHKKLLGILELISPSKRDANLRQRIIHDLSLFIKSHLSKYEKVIFGPCGSSYNGTYLPDSDIDIAILVHPCDDIEAVMKSVSLALGKMSEFDVVKQLPFARVPVLKVKANPGVNVDISFGTLHGPLAVSYFQRVYSKYPYLHGAQLFLKLLLYHYDVNEPFTGGISSYVLQIMIISYIQLHSCNSLTDIVLGFLKFYGQEFNFFLTGIDVANEGRLFSRYVENCMSYDSPVSMHIIDPLNPSNILGDNAFKIREIKDIFANVYRKLTSPNWNEFFAELDETVDSLVKLKKQLVPDP